MRSTITAVVTIAAMSAGPVAPATTASAQDAPEASEPGAQSDTSDTSDTSDDTDYKTLARRGSQAFADKDYAAAADAFRRAYAIKAIPNLLYNAGRALEKTGDFEGAIAAYDKFVNAADVELKARQDALQRLKTLREVLALRNQGNAVDDDTVEARQGDRGLAEPTPTTSARAAAAVEPDYTLAWVFTSVGAASLIGSGSMAWLASRQHTDADDAATLGARRDAIDTGQTYATVADGLLGAGVVLAGIGLYFWLSPPEAATRARLSPTVGAGEAAMTLTLDF